MLVNGTRIFALFIISTVMININDARSWDLAVTIGQEVDFFSKNGTLIRQITFQDAKKFSSITYDDASHTIFLSDSKNKNGSIFFNKLQSVNNEMYPLLHHINGSHIMGIIYDPLSESLIWSDVVKKAIFKMHINLNITKEPEMTKDEPEILLNLTNETPRGLSIDYCNRRLYWANSNRSNPSISCVNIDGTNYTTIIRENLYEPVAVTIDHTTAKLYWLNDDEGIHYQVERSNLDGTNRERIVRGKHQQPIHIAVDHDNIYWTDWTYHAIWSIKKDIALKDVPKKWKLFDNSNSDPLGLVARDNIENLDCLTMIAATKNNLANKIQNTDNDRYNTLATDIEENSKNNITSKSLRLCLNDGYYNETTGSCQCKQGYNGQHCQQSLCENYCFHGECKITDDTSVECECPSEYRGSRCEKYACSDYCLNGGECSMRQGEPHCTCKFSQGKRCENITDIEYVCDIFCANPSHESQKTEIKICSCSKKNSTDHEYTIYQYDSWTDTLIIILSIVIGVLTVIIIILSYFVNKFRRRPRIKKRFVVSKNGITPLTSRPQLPDDQCEIMIENCCNMNICETPCFEPKLRNSQANTSKKEEKNSLLNHMEGNNSC